MKPITSSATPAPKRPPTEVPAPLPRALLPELLSRERLLVCLDFDGTLSEITALPSQARPVRFARRALIELAGYPQRIELAIVSGRDLKTLRAMLGIERGLQLAGSHGLELAGRSGQHHIAPGAESAAPALETVRAWMKHEIPPRAGFIIEDKGVALALHYRTAAPAAAANVRESLRRAVEAQGPSLEILTGKKVDEVLPRGASRKGAAVRAILDSMGTPPARAVYFGDDLTDEDAFLELEGDGITVRVGAPQRSFAHYRVARPADVAAILNDMSATLRRSLKPA